VLPQATTGIAATEIFCLIFSWNEYAFALLLDLGSGADGAAVHPDHHRRGRARLAGRGCRDHPVPAAGRDLHRDPQEASAARDHLRGGAGMNVAATRSPGPRRFLRRTPWENAATAVIGLGVFMLMQPFALWLYSHSFAVILVGTIGFVIVSHFPEE
jgi:hypothetical protein